MSDEGIEQKYIKEAFDTNWVVPLGPNVIVYRLWGGAETAWKSKQ